MLIEADYLIVGSGLTGLFFALKAAEIGSVVMITKEEPRESNTNYAQGGIASAVGPEDSFAQHVEDTLAAGDGLCDPQVVEEIVREGPGVVRELIELGARFTREESGALALGREGGHSVPRVVHAEDLTGQELVRVLLAASQRQERIRIYPHHLAVELIVDAEQRCRGVWALDVKGRRWVELRAPVTLLATGGSGQIYLYTTNPPVATGDGIAMAWRAGARVGNLEFVQFHPTMLYHPQGRPFLISEAVRGYGGILVDHRGRPFIRHPLGSLATRDVVARAIVEEMQHSGRECVYLDITGKDPEMTRRRFPNIYRYCLEIGIDMTRQPIPVVPAAHYMCGGVCVDLNGQTDIEGLYASGEVAMTGFHGANRLASNSLLEALVLAKRAFARASQTRPSQRAICPTWDRRNQEGPPEAGVVDRLRHRLRRCLWEEVGIIRSDRGLERACGELAELAAQVEALYQRHALVPELIELRNMAAVAQLVAHAARLRQESRGGHYNLDHPHRDDDHWAHPILLDPKAMLAVGKGACELR